MSNKRDQIYRQDDNANPSVTASFRFDERVADVFSDMISRSVPGYQQILGMLCLLYTSPSPRDLSTSRMPSSA